ncbi:MAG: glycosyltransferase [Sphingobacteriales bacterium]|nr:MAG: glycosyltransferase [Sphingobacteriales bacterium]
MNVLFISRSTLYKDRGGDTVQIENTASSLRELGLNITIKLTNEKIDYTPYDLVHYFNIIRPADISGHIKKSNKPYVVSTIFVDYGEYETTQRSGAIGILAKLVSSDNMEYLKAIGRYVINGEKINSWSYFLNGHRKSIQSIIRHAGLLLPNSHSEYERLRLKYNVSAKYRVVPNAIDPERFLNIQTNVYRDPKLVICVGRIEGRKNQLNLIRALNNTSFKLMIIGSPSANQVKFYQQCRREAGSNITFIDQVPQEQLLAYYNSAKVHVLASWFETTGLSTMEAAAMGCNIVITDKGDTREYFENYAYYCDPSSPASIFNAIDEASQKPYNDMLRNKILENFTWHKAAEVTREAYLELKDAKQE